jgi:lipid A ethanolaminephosphotransferase
MISRCPAIGSTTLAMLVAAWLLFLTNHTFWTKILSVLADQPIDLALLGLMLFLLYFAVLLVFSAPYIIKPVYIFAIWVAASASYFTDEFGIMVDRDMIQNVAQTNGAESSHLLTANLAWHLLIFGVLPSLAVLWVCVVHLPIWQKVRRNTVVILGCLAVCAGVIAVNSRTFIPLWQHQRETTMSYLNPAMPFIGTIDYAQRQMRDINIVAGPYGRDAKQGPRIAASPKKMLTIIVVGETARAQNFSLNGYERDTNPELKARDVFAFQNVTSCGTATAVSLPCMFSHIGHDNYSRRAALSSENLVDVLQHAGLKVEWWENNTGPKSVADRIPTVTMSETGDNALCRNGECLDEILVKRLRDHIADFKDNSVLVVHTMGSHGPAYFQRYEPAFEKFKPACQNPELSECSSAELVNAYDNSILYTDHILASIIDVLKEHSGEFASSMIYMSDHGESLGEDGVYLHGAPYAIAPDTQTHIPFITWMSDDFAKTNEVDTACIRGKEGDRFSHDNLFDTVLGMMDVQTSVYNQTLDAFASCRRPAQTASR